MNRKEISEKLNKTYKSMISSDFDSVVHKIKNKKGVLLDMNEKESKSMRGLVVSLLAVCILCVGVLVIDKTKQDNNVFATINFDVNPSIEIKINKSSEVIDYSSYNEDGTKILDNMDLKGVKLDVATNAIIGSLYKNGYITSENNSILISVFNEDNSHVELDGIVSEIDEYLNNNNINSSVISQEVKLNDQLKETASKYNVSLGKVKLINRLIEVNPLYNFDDLVKLNTNELNLLINDSKNNVVDVKTYGDASTKKYIGESKALDVVYKHAKVNEKDVSNLEINMDYDDGVMVYDIEFYYNKLEYDYEINALNGNIVDYEHDKEVNVSVKPESSDKKNYISKVDARDIVLKRAGVTKVNDYEIEFEYQAGVAVYEIDFETTTKSYEIIMNALTGEIIYYDVENEEDDDMDEGKVPSQNDNKTTYISKSKAKSIALNDAGVSKYYDYEIETDTVNGVRVYEISFETSTKEYEYTINAKTGKIINREVENVEEDD